MQDVSAAVQLTDTHCHIHAADPKLSGEVHTLERWQNDGIQVETMLSEARQAGVKQLICVGTTPDDSKAAIDFAAGRDNVWATVGIHPHEADHYQNNQPALEQFARLAARPKVVAIGECGLDYFYQHSPKDAQIALLTFHLELAQKHQLPLVFHIRDAFADFWPVFDQYPGLTGVVHSFTATQKELQAALDRGLYIGLNGIMTFTKDPAQLAAAKAVPTNKLVLETDAPFLTPVPFRGKICTPKYVRVTAEFLSDLRGQTLEELAAATSDNAAQLFKL